MIVTQVCKLIKYTDNYPIVIYFHFLVAEYSPVIELVVVVIFPFSSSISSTSSFRLDLKRRYWHTNHPVYPRPINSISLGNKGTKLIAQTMVEDSHSATKAPPPYTAATDLFSMASHLALRSPTMSSSCLEGSIVLSVEVALTTRGCNIKDSFLEALLLLRATPKMVLLKSTWLDKVEQLTELRDTDAELTAIVAITADASGTAATHGLSEKSINQSIDRSLGKPRSLARFLPSLLALIAATTKLGSLLQSIISFPRCHEAITAAMDMAAAMTFES
ncbi:hypothetical protein Mapa_010556 [Marchantia paleacea]|nr:hypothetical protein Mapa_010556 [Marchantia paleacea]